MEGNEESLTRTSSVLQKVHLFETSSGATGKMQSSDSTKMTSAVSSESNLNDPRPVTSLNYENVKPKCKQPLDSAESNPMTMQLESSQPLKHASASRLNIQPPKPAPRPSPRHRRSSGSLADKKCPIPQPQLKVLSPQCDECPTDEFLDSSEHLMDNSLTVMPTTTNIEPCTLQETISFAMPKSKSDYSIYNKQDGQRQVSHQTFGLQPLTPAPRPSPRVKHNSEPPSSCSHTPNHSYELPLHYVATEDQTENPRPLPQFKVSSPEWDECPIDDPDTSGNQTDYTQTPTTGNTEPIASCCVLSVPTDHSTPQTTTDFVKHNSSRSECNFDVNEQNVPSLVSHSTLTPGAPRPSPRVRRTHATPSHRHDTKESQIHTPQECQISLETECKSSTGHGLQPLDLCDQPGQTPGPEPPKLPPSVTYQVSELSTSSPLIPPKPPSLVSKKPVPVPPLQSESKLASELGAIRVEYSRVLQTTNPEAELLTLTQSTRVKKDKPLIPVKPSKQALQAKKFISSNVVKPGLKFAKRVQKKFGHVKKNSKNQLPVLSMDEDFDELPEEMKSDFCNQFLVSAEMALKRLLGLNEFSSASDQIAMKQVQKQIRLKKIPISVFGIHNAGKSTLLNALLGARFLPVANTNETSVRVAIEHDENVHEGFCPQGNECKACPWISGDSEASVSGIQNIYEFLVSINDHVRQNKLKAKEYTIHAHVPMIATTKELKLCFEDTPGFGEADHDNIIKQAETALSGSSAYLYIMPYDQIDDGRNIKAFKSIHGRDKGAFEDGRVVIGITHFDKHYEMRYDDEEDDEDSDEGDDESMMSTPKSIVSTVHDGVHKATGMNISERNVVLVSGLWALHSLMLRNNTKDESDIKGLTLWRLKKYANDNNISESQWKEKSLEARLWEASGVTAVVERINNLVKACFDLWIRGLHGKCEKFLQSVEETVRGNADNFRERDLKGMETEYETQMEKLKTCKRYEDEMKCVLTKETSSAYQELHKGCFEDIKEPYESAWEVVEKLFGDFSNKCRQKCKQKYTKDDFESDVTSFLNENISPTFREEFTRSYDSSRALEIKSTHSEHLVIISENLIRATCDFIGKSHENQGDHMQELHKKGPRTQEVITKQELDLEELKDKLPAPTFKRDVIQYLLHMMTLGIAGDDGRRVDVEEPLRKLHEKLLEDCMQYRSSVTQTLVEHFFGIFQEVGKGKLEHYHRVYNEDMEAAKARLQKQMKDIEEAHNKVQNMDQLEFYCSRMRTHLSRMKRDLLQASLTELDESATPAKDKPKALTGEEIQHELDESDTPAEEFDKNNLKTTLAGDEIPVCTENEHENKIYMDSLEEHVQGQVTVYYPEGFVKDINIQSGTTLRALLLSSAAESEDFLSNHEPYIDDLKIDWDSDCSLLSGKKIVLVQNTTLKATEAEASTSDSILLTERPTPEDKPTSRVRSQVVTKRKFFSRLSKRRSQGGIAAIKLVDNQRPVTVENIKTKPPDETYEVINTFEEDFRNPDLLSTCKAIKHRLKELQQEHMVLNLVSSELLSLWEETEEKRICIAVFGYHKTGKSSFINALAGMGLLPVNRRKETVKKVNIQHNSDIHCGPCKKSCQNCQVLLYKDRTTCSEVAKGRRIASTLHDIHNKIQDGLAQDQGEYIIQANIPCISAVPPPWQVCLQDNPSFSAVTDETAIRNLRDDIMTLSLYIYLIRYDQLDDSVHGGAFKIIAEQDLAKAAGLEQRLLIVVTHFEACYDGEDFPDKKSLKTKVCKLIKDAISREFPPDNVIPVCTLWARKAQQLAHQPENEDLKLDALLALESCYAKYKCPRGSITAKPKDMPSSELAESLIAVSGIREVEAKVSQMACCFGETSALTIHDGFSNYLSAAAQKVEDLKTTLSEDSSRKELKRRTMEVRKCLEDFKLGTKSTVYNDLLTQCREPTTMLSAILLQRSKGFLTSLHEECLQSIEQKDESFTREKLLSEFTTLVTKLENMQEEVSHESLSFIKVIKCFENCLDAVDTNYSEVCQHVNGRQPTQPQAFPAVKLEAGEIFTIIAENMHPLQIKHEEITTGVDLPQPKRTISEKLRKRPKWYTRLCKHIFITPLPKRRKNCGIDDQIKNAFSTFEMLICNKISTYTNMMETTVAQAIFRKFCKYTDAKLKEFDKNFAELLKDDEEEMKRLTAWNEHLRKLQQHLRLKYEESLVVK